MSIERHGGLRAAIAVEAARLMYEEEVKQYFTAKRMAAKRILGRVEGRRVHYRPADLPSNGEIRDALLAMAELCEGSLRTARLFAMRIVALEAMRALTPFEPRLIGSVSTGHIRRGSDIDISVFTVDEEPLEHHLRALGWSFERERVSIQKFGQIREYLHFHVIDIVPIELTVYDPRELRFRQKSSTDGKPILRFKIPALEALLKRDHEEAWSRYLADGTVEGMSLLTSDEDDEDLPAQYDGLLSDEEPDPELPEPGEEEDPEQVYDPLPGFEAWSDVPA